jgi:hypothetical protein
MRCVVMTPIADRGPGPDMAQPSEDPGGHAHSGTLIRQTSLLAPGILPL